MSVLSDAVVLSVDVSSVELPVSVVDSSVDSVVDSDVSVEDSSVDSVEDSEVVSSEKTQTILWRTPLWTRW